MRKKNVYIVMEDWDAFYTVPDKDHEHDSNVVAVFSDAEKAKEHINGIASLFDSTKYSVTIEKEGWIVKAECDDLGGHIEKTGERSANIFPDSENYTYRVIEEEVK